MRSTKPFGKTLLQLMNMGDVGVRELARRTERRGWGSSTTISKLTRGEIRPSLQAMEAIAVAMETEPETFAEYRLLVLRRQLDPDVVGLAPALKTLERLEDRS